MINTDKTFNQFKLIDDFINNYGFTTCEIRNRDHADINSILIPLRNGHQSATFLSRIEQLQTATIYKPEEIAKTFNHAEHKFLVLTKTL